MAYRSSDRGQERRGESQGIAAEEGRGGGRGGDPDVIDMNKGRYDHRTALVMMLHQKLLD